jgi:RimJ/RimL family protein N-acetyltransferase
MRVLSPILKVALRRQSAEDSQSEACAVQSFGERKMASLDPKTVDLKDGRKIVLRCAVESDASAVLEHFKLLMLDGEGMIMTFEEYAVSEDQLKARIKSANDDPRDLLLVAESGGMVVGSIDFNIAKRQRCSHWGSFGMGVRVGWRSSGVGNALLSRLLEWALSNPEIEKVTLAVRADNPRAVALYKKHGFVLSGCDKAYLKLSDGSYVDDLRMERFVR